MALPVFIGFVYLPSWRDDSTFQYHVCCGHFNHESSYQLGMICSTLDGSSVCDCLDTETTISRRRPPGLNPPFEIFLSFFLSLSPLYFIYLLVVVSGSVKTGEVPS